MSASFHLIDHQEVIVVLNDLAPGQAFPAVVHTAHPLTVKITMPIPRLPHGTRMVLLYRVDGVHHKVSCRVSEAVVRETTTFTTLGIESHENLERRRSDRLPADIEGEIAYVRGAEDAPEITRCPCRLTEISPHGAWVETDLRMKCADLCSLSVPLPGEPTIRALCVCSRAKEGKGLGLDFVDFVGDASDRLKRLVERIRSSAA